MIIPISEVRCKMKIFDNESPSNVRHIILETAKEIMSELIDKPTSDMIAMIVPGRNEITVTPRPSKL